MYSLSDIHAERMVMKYVAACYLAWYGAESIKVELHGYWRHGYLKNACFCLAFIWKMTNGLASKDHLCYL